MSCEYYERESFLELVDHGMVMMTGGSDDASTATRQLRESLHEVLYVV